MNYHIVFSQAAKQQLGMLFDYIADAEYPELAEQFTAAIVNHCRLLQSFPCRGTMRDDVRPGLRVTNYKKRVVIAFAVEEAEKTVFIIGLFYGGQNYEAVLHEEFEEQ